MAKHPALKFRPTFDVVVAWPEMLRPKRVVVPNPEPETERAAWVVVAVPSMVVVAKYRLPPAFRVTH